MINFITQQVNNKTAIVDNYKNTNYGTLISSVREVCKKITELDIHQKIIGVKGFNNWGWISSILAIWESNNTYLPVVFDADFKLCDYVIDSNILIEGKNKFIQKTMNNLSLNNTKGYITSSSGSTGNPKWIYGNVDGLIDFINWEKDCINASDKDKFVSITAPNFDPVFREILYPLSIGAELHILENRDELIKNTQRFLNYINDNNNCTTFNTILGSILEQNK